MFADLIQRLTGGGPAKAPEADERLALAALLVRLARADGDYATRERERIEAILTRRYGLGPWEAAALCREAETLEETAPDTVRFTKAIKEAVPYDRREAVIEAAWAVVLADGARADEEDALMRLIASLLGVNDRDSNLARLRAQGQDADNRE